MYFLDTPFVCIHVHAGDPRVPPRLLASGSKPCGGNYPIQVRSIAFKLIDTKYRQKTPQIRKVKPRLLTDF